MNILQINYEYPPLGGGGGVFNKQFAEELAGRHNITVITSQFRNEKHHEVINGVEVFRVPILQRSDQNAATITSLLSFFPSSLFTGYRLLRERKYDLIHSLFTIPSAPSGILLAKAFGIPHVLSILGGDIYDPSKKLSPHHTPVLHKTVESIINNSEKVVSLSADIKKRALEHYNIRVPIDIVHLGIPKPLQISDERANWSLSKDDEVLVTVGRLVARKALHELVEAIAGINDPSVKLLVVGDGPKRPELEELSTTLGISDQIRFCGYVSDETKFGILNMCDAYVSSSHHEGFGIVFLEAMSAGLPVVCYDNGGQTEYLRDGENGFLVKLGDVRGLTKKIYELCSKDDLRQRMSAHNRAHVEQFYIDECARRFEDVYNGLVDGAVNEQSSLQAASTAEA